jgi:hypothetical protein
VYNFWDHNPVSHTGSALATAPASDQPVKSCGAKSLCFFPSDRNHSSVPCKVCVERAVVGCWVARLAEIGRSGIVFSRADRMIYLLGAIASQGRRKGCRHPMAVIGGSVQLFD